MNHTPEPWELRFGGTITGKIDAPWGDETVVVANIDGPNRVDLIKMRNANRKRIVACVNACAGIKDPETVIPALIKALQFYADPAGWKDVETGVGMHPGETIDFGATAQVALNQLNS